MLKQQINQEIDEVQNDEAKLYSYLYDLVYKERSNDIDFLEEVYRKFIQDDRIEIVRVSIYSLLFGLKIKNEEYRKIAMEYAGNAESDFDLRLNCLSGLSEAYAGAKDKQLLFLFQGILNNADEDTDIRAQAFICSMKMLGMTSVEIMRKNKNIVVISLDDISFEHFTTELTEIEKLMK